MSTTGEKFADAPKYSTCRGNRVPNLGTMFRGGLAACMGVRASAERFQFA